MPSPNEQLQPTPFEPSPTAGASAPQPANHRPLWPLLALGALLLVAALVVFWLPGHIEPQPEPMVANSPAPVRTVPAAAARQPQSVAADASPWTDAQLAKLRKAAQDVLEELLTTQSQLEQHSVEQWAPAAFKQALAGAAAGDELYRTRHYEQATTRYADALQRLQALQDKIPSVLAEQLQALQQALQQGKQEDADASVTLIAKLAPDHPELPALRQRAAKLPQLTKLLEQAADAEKNSDLARARATLQQAVALDPEHLRAQNELQRVSRAYNRQLFNAAMSEGYAALDQGDFDAGRHAFERARKLQPQSGEVVDALQQLQTARTAQTLSVLKTRGQRQEQQEQWAKAVDSYKSALKIDPNVLFAREGLTRSRARAELDRQLRETIARPERFADIAAANAAEQLLARARKISARGSLLTGQIEQLQQQLQQASIPVAVTLVSDMATEVTVYHVARLGQFKQRVLKLRPGVYTAVGSREGFRDVRRTFRLSPNGQQQSVNISCSEPI